MFYFYYIVFVNILGFFIFVFCYWYVKFFLLDVECWLELIDLREFRISRDCFVFSLFGDDSVLEEVGVLVLEKLF